MDTSLDDLAVFVAIAEERSFSRAAARLGKSRPLLSRDLASLERRLGMRLLDRTTRRVAPTDVGQILLTRLQSSIGDIRDCIDVLAAQHGRPAGSLRLTMVKRAATDLILPVLPRFLREYPEVRVEIDVDDRLVDIVEDRYDAGIRLGELVARDMIGVKLTDASRVAVVASPGYLAGRPPPTMPRELGAHACIGFRRPTDGAIQTWRFARGTKRTEARGPYALTFNDGDLIRAAAKEGMGVAYLYEDLVLGDLADGSLTRLLDDWCPSMPGLFLYHTSRRHPPPPLRALIAELRRTA